MRRFEIGTEGRTVAMAAAVAVALALVSLVDHAFTPVGVAGAPVRASGGVQVEVAIVPARIEVVAVRARDVAQETPSFALRRPRS